MKTIYQVVIEKDFDRLGDEGSVIASYDTEEPALAFVAGVEYVNDSGLWVVVEKKDIEIEKEIK